ncbi:24293_t:CDS:1, partial [Racocetra persica]
LTLIMTSLKPFSCYLCNNSYSSKSSLSCHEITKHSMNRIVPHYQHLPTISEGIINHFRAVLLQDINSKLGFHRTNEGLKHIQWNFPESLFYFFFSNESGFSYRPSLRRYSCVFKGQNGYNRIGQY